MSHHHINKVEKNKCNNTFWNRIKFSKKKTSIKVNPFWNNLSLLLKESYYFSH